MVAKKTRKSYVVLESFVKEGEEENTHVEGVFDTYEEAKEAIEKRVKREKLDDYFVKYSDIYYIITEGPCGRLLRGRERAQMWSTPGWHLTERKRRNKK